MDNTTRITLVKSFLFANIKFILYPIWLIACIVVPISGFKLLGYLYNYFVNANMDLVNPFNSGYITNLFTAFILIGTKNWVPYVQRWCSQRLLPVNITIKSNHLNQFLSYHETLTTRIRALLPEEIKLAWKNGNNSLTNEFMMPLNAEELVSSSTKHKPRGRIDDLLLVLDLEYFLNVKDRLQPITIQGDPGSGKSTLIFELYRQFAARLQDREQGWIPILIFAHELSWEMLEKQSSLKDLLLVYLSKCAEQAQDGGGGYKDLAHLISNNYDIYQFIIIIDGLDEITNRPLYLKITSKLNELLEAEWKSIKSKSSSAVHRYIISCRTDDNQRIIISRLISLLPIKYQTVLDHLRKLRKSYKHNYEDIADPNKEQKLQNVITGLEGSKAHRLLQNYTSNPYLLSLIIEYYSEENKYVQTLNVIFKEVLERELRKPAKEFENESAQKNRLELLPYLSSLLAPYCYVRIMDTLQGRESNSEDFSRYIVADKQLADILIGFNGQVGYLEAVYKGRPEIREDKFSELKEIWKKEKTEQFRHFLDEQLKLSPSYAVFIEGAIKYLYHDVLSILLNYSLIEIDENTKTIKRFRHRRMQDYFMALYIDKVGIKSASIPLGNAWMREPIRLIAAVSANPLGIIDAFLDEYKLNENRIYDKNNNSINDLADLMLNASEAIAYLPRFPSTKMGGVLHKSVLDLGLKAHNLYFRVSSNAVDKNKGTRVGWLGLMAKCLTAIKNIYASEFLRNNPSTCNIRRKTEKNREENIWKLIYRRLQQEPDSFQHLAYLQLYPIKRAQDHFPIRAYSLFYLAMDAAVCFPTAYDRLIKETHKTSLSRIPCWIAKKFEWLVSLLLPGLILSLIWYFDTTLGILLKLIYTLLAILSFITFARIIQALRFMNWRESHHFFTWLVLKTWKYTWSQVQLLGQFLADNTFYLFTYLWKLFINIPRLIRYSIELIRDLIVELVKTSFKHPTKIISVISLLVLVGIAYKYGVPYGASILKALEFSGRIETLSGNNAEIDKQLPVFKQKTSEFLNETPSEISQNKQSQLLKEIGEYNERLINMQNDGNSLLVASQELPKSEQEINTYLSEINKKSQLLKELESEILRKGEEIHYVLRLEFYKKKLVETENETQELLKYYKDSSVDNSSSISTDITKCITRIEELLNEKEGLIQFNPEISGEISPRLQQLQWGKEQLELIVAELAQKGGIASSASNSESSTTNETLKTQLDNRADQVLARTVLEDISENRTFITKLLLQNGQKLSEIEKSLSADSESLSERIGFIRRGNIDSNLQFLSRLESIDNQFPQMKSQLSTYKTELSDVIADVRSGQYVMEKLSLLEKRLSEVNICLSELDKYTVLREQFNIKLIQDTLTQKKDEADKLSAQQVSSLGGILISAVIFLFILFIRNRYGDETGIQKLLLIKGNFGALLDFVKDNRYSDKVNEIAIAYLREALPSDSQSLRLSLRLISDAAEQRFKKAGELNESVGYLLFDLEKGIENIVNRESTSK